MRLCISIIGFLLTLLSTAGCNTGNNSKVPAGAPTAEAIPPPQLKDTTAATEAPTPLTDLPNVPATPPPPKGMPGPAKPAQPKKLTGSNTIYHYYTTGRISVLITPWNNYRRKILLYDNHGLETYDMEEVRMSYSISVNLSFHPNGAVSKAEVHNNPGGSRYWYEGVITFDTANQPLTQLNTRMPQESLEDMMNNKPQVWDTKNRKWIKQDTAPGGF